MQQRPVYIHIQHWEKNKKIYSAPKELKGKQYFCVLCKLCLCQTAQVRFIRDKTIYTQQLDALRNRIGDKHISRAQPFYELTSQSHKVCFL